MVHDQIYKLRRQYSELEKRAVCLTDEWEEMSRETIEKRKINILLEIEQLQLTILSL